MSTIDELRTLVAQRRAALEEAETQLRDLVEPIATRPISQYELKKQVVALALNDTPAYRKAWKKVLDDGLLENVQSILDDCYDHYCNPKVSDMEDDLVASAKARFGKIHSRQWQEFTLLVIKYLKKNGSFGEETDTYGFDSFEDTAGGCDEITWDAGIYLIENPEWND